MDLQNLLNQFMGALNVPADAGQQPRTQSGDTPRTTGQMHGGLAAGAAAGGIMALLLSNKSARKVAGKAAKYGGAAVLGTMAYKAYQNWQQGNNSSALPAGDAAPVTLDSSDFTREETLSGEFQLRLVKAMITAAKADGHIDEMEQQRIFKAVENMQMSNDMKAMLFDLMRNPVAVEELAHGVHTIEQKSELYLASWMAIDPDHPAELAHLDKLARCLQLPNGLAQQLQRQVSEAMAAT
jgi:uncharacterized membrane protein YebE (DUF533 family)